MSLISPATAGPDPGKGDDGAPRRRVDGPLVRTLLGLTVITLLVALTALAVRQYAGFEAQQRGFALITYTPDGYQSPEMPNYLSQISGTGATWVQFNVTWYQAGTATDTIAAGAQTPSDSSVQRAISLAHEHGLKVMLKPSVDLLDLKFRGDIRPADSTAWFASYTAFINHYAELAARTGVEQLSVGAELAGVSGDRSGWLRVVTSVRARYRGPLVYSALFGEYQHVAFWDVLDLIGVAAYWQLAEHPSTDVDALRRAWRPIVNELKAYAARTGRRILFSEAGYTSQQGTATKPWDWTISETTSQAEQAAAYEALLTSLQDQPWWAGVFWWCWDVPLAEHPNDPLGYTPHGKAAESVVRNRWT